MTQYQTPIMMFTKRHKKGDSWIIHDAQTGKSKLYMPDNSLFSVNRNYARVYK